MLSASSTFATQYSLATSAITAPQQFNIQIPSRILEMFPNTSNNLNGINPSLNTNNLFTQSRPSPIVPPSNVPTSQSPRSAQAPRSASQSPAQGQLPALGGYDRISSSSSDTASPTYIGGNSRSPSLTQQSPGPLSVDPYRSASMSGLAPSPGPLHISQPSPSAQFGPGSGPYEREDSYTQEIGSQEEGLAFNPNSSANTGQGHSQGIGDDDDLQDMPDAEQEQDDIGDGEEMNLAGEVTVPAPSQYEAPSPGEQDSKEDLQVNTPIHGQNQSTVTFRPPHHRYPEYAGSSSASGASHAHVPRRVTANDGCLSIVNSLMTYRLPVGEPETFARKAIESLVKKLKDRREELDALITAVSTRGQTPSRCITIQRTLDGRLQVAGRKGFPHVIYSRIWRWADLHKNEMKHTKNCQYGFELKLEHVCVNPYHYERVAAPAIDFTTLSLTNAASEMHQTQGGQPMFTSNGNHGQHLGNIQMPMQQASRPAESAAAMPAHSYTFSSNALPTQIILPSGSFLPRIPALPPFFPPPPPQFRVPLKPMAEPPIENAQSQASPPAQGRSPSPVKFSPAQEPKVQGQALTQAYSHSLSASSVQSSSASLASRKELLGKRSRDSIQDANEDTGHSEQVEEDVPSDWHGPITFPESEAGGSHPLPPWIPEHGHKPTFLPHLPTSYSIRELSFPSDWCSLSYYELKRQIVSEFNVSTRYSTLTVDGYTDPQSPNRFCLGQYTSPEQETMCRKTLLHIGKGIELMLSEHGDVWITVRSDRAAFVLSDYMTHSAAIDRQRVQGMYDREHESRDPWASSSGGGGGGSGSGSAPGSGPASVSASSSNPFARQSSHDGQDPFSSRTASFSHRSVLSTTSTGTGYQGLDGEESRSDESDDRNAPGLGRHLQRRVSASLEGSRQGERDRERRGRPPAIAKEVAHKLYPGSTIKVFDIRYCYYRMLKHFREKWREKMLCTKAGITSNGSSIKHELKQHELPEARLGTSETGNDEDDTGDNVAHGVSIDQLHRNCIIYVSFVKGWGQDYPMRPTITDSPCWLEIRMTRAFQLLDILMHYSDSVMPPQQQQHSPLSESSLPTLAPTLPVGFFPPLQTMPGHRASLTMPSGMHNAL